MTGENLKELFHSIAAGDQQAFKILFSNWYPKLFGTAHRYGKSEALASDICQQVFLSIWERREILTAVDHPEAWLNTTVRNQAFQLLKKEFQKEDFLQQLAGIEKPRAVNPEEALLNTELRNIIQKALTQLSPRQLEIYRMGREEGMTYAEIARALQVGHETVKEHMSNALKSIRASLLRHRGDLLSVLAFIKIFF